MSCPVSSSCDYQKPLDILCREAFVKTDTGCLAINATEVTDASASCEALTCSEQSLPLDQLLSKLFTTNDQGCTVLKIIVTTP